MWGLLVSTIVQHDVQLKSKVCIKTGGKTDCLPTCRYLLLEDADTGDILMPLIYMKAVIEANNSRKLSSLKNRLVVLPAEVEPDARPSNYMYWQWAFESPQNVKLLVRQELGEKNTPQVSTLLFEKPFRHQPPPPTSDAIGIVCCLS